MSDQFPVINPPHHAAAAKEMVRIIDDKLAEVEKKLARSFLDREPYLLLFGEGLALRTMRDELQKVYRRAFEQ